MSKEKIYQLPMTRDYISHWGLEEALRELLQNAIDHAKGEPELKFEDGTLTITSPMAYLQPRTLLLGATTKAEDSSAIGHFGEGYKLALLVLTRLGHPVTVFNQDLLWVPKFAHSEEFGAEVLQVVSTKAEAPQNALSFKIYDLDPEHISSIRELCLFLQTEEEIGEVIKTDAGTILLERPGELFVGGLYVCKTNLSFSYDFKPEFLQLDRDRQTVSSFDLQWATKDMWFRTGLYSKISELIAEGVRDLEYANYGTPELVKEACFNLFRSQHPGAVAAKSQAELEALIAQGMTKVIVVNNTYRDLVMTSERMLEESGVIAPLAPQQVLEEFLEDHKHEFSEQVTEAFGILIERSKSWRLG